MKAHSFYTVRCAGALHAGKSAPIGGATVEYPWVAASEIVTRVRDSRRSRRVFVALLTAFTHESTSFLDCVIERNAEKRRNSAFYTLPRVACREDCSDWLNLELFRTDWSTYTLL